MRVVFVFLMVLTAGLCGQELVIRAYRVSPENLRASFRDSPLVISPGKVFGLYSDLVSPEAPFESRFFEGEVAFHDFSVSQRGFGFLWGKEAKMVYAIKNQLLVVKAEAANHDIIETNLDRFVERQLLMEVEILRSGERGANLRKSADPDPGKGESLGAMMGIFHEGVESLFRSKELGWNCQVETRLGNAGKVWYSDLKLKADGEEFEFAMDTELVGVVGVPLEVPLGVADGKGNLAVKVSMKVVRQDGSYLDDWVQSENEEGFLMKQRLRELAKDRKKEPRITTLENGIQRARVLIPKTFLTPFTDPFGEDPFEVGRVDLANFLEGKGLQLGKRDRAVLVDGREGYILFLQSPKKNVELMAELGVGITPPPALLSCDLYLVESEKKIEEKALAEGGFRVISQISSSQTSGTLSKVFLGEELHLEATMQLNTGGEMIDAKLSGGGEMGKFEVEIEAEIGEPVVVKQFQADGRWRAWVATAKIVEVGE